MRDYTYKGKELEYIRYIKSNSPKKIWWDFTEYVFDYNEVHYKLECLSEIADTQNKTDEAIIAKLTKHIEQYRPRMEAKLVCENKRIEDMYIVRTFLYFSTFKSYSRFEIFTNRLKCKAKAILTGKKDFLGDIISKASGGGEELTCSPKSEQAQKVNPRYSNLIDTGFLIQIDGKLLKAFIESNGFGFHIWNDKFFFEPNELASLAGQYEFIKV